MLQDRLQLIGALGVLSTQKSRKLPPIDQCPQADPEDDLDALVGRVVGQDNPIVIMSDNKPVGVVTKDALLRGIQGEV